MYSCKSSLNQANRLTLEHIDFFFRLSATHVAVFCFIWLINAIAHSIMQIAIGMLIRTSMILERRILWRNVWHIVEF